MCLHFFRPPSPPPPLPAFSAPLLLCAQAFFNMLFRILLHVFVRGSLFPDVWVVMVMLTYQIVLKVLRVYTPVLLRLFLAPTVSENSYRPKVVEATSLLGTAFCLPSPRPVDISPIILILPKQCMSPRPSSPPLSVETKLPSPPSPLPPLRQQLRDYRQCVCG